MRTTNSPADHKVSKRILIVAALVIAGFTGAAWLDLFGKSVETNDAQIDGHIHPLSARVAGTVTWVNSSVEDTRRVVQGDVIARLDPDDYSPTVDRMTSELAKNRADLLEASMQERVSSAQAEAKRDQAAAAVAQAQADIAHRQAEANEAKAQVANFSAQHTRAQQDLGRYGSLLKVHEVSRSEFDRRKEDADATQAQVDAARAKEIAAEQNIVIAQHALKQRLAELDAASPVAQIIQAAHARTGSLEGTVGVAEASLRRARLDLGYTQVIAPVSGVVGKKDVEVGQHIAPGDPLLSITSQQELWVTAYYRETQLRHVAVGDPVSVKVDSSNEELKGAVESIGGATGSRYSPLPPENATGNFIKVVQRVPVRITLTLSPERRAFLVPGMSVEATIHGSK